MGGGYLAWREPTTHEWWAWDWINIPQPVFRSLGLLSDPTKPLRQQVDAFALNPQLFTGASPSHPQVQAARERLASSRAASRANAALIEEQIAELIAEVTPPEGSLHDVGRPPDFVEDGPSGDDLTRRAE